MTTRRPGRSGPTGFEALNEIGARLGELIGAVQSTIEKASDGAKSGSGFEGAENTRDFTIDTEKGPLKATMGWRIRVGGLASDSAGSASSAADRAEVKRAETEKPVREPLVDVFAEKDHVLVTAELPGVAAKDVNLAFEGTSLTIETTGATRFRAVVDLPADVDQDNAPTRALRNGILELRFKTKG